MPPLYSHFAPWFAPFTGALQMGEMILHAMNAFAGVDEPSAPFAEESVWTTPGEVRLELPTMRIRECGPVRRAASTLIVAPYALHRATLADFASMHSLVECLLAMGVPGVAVVECRSADLSMRSFSVDDYLADLLVAVEDCGDDVTLVGLCQGGWLSMILAARFPELVRRIVVVGAPLDMDAASSGIVECTRLTSPAVFETFVTAGLGLLRGRLMLTLWNTPEPPPREIAGVLQAGAVPSEALVRRFRRWHRSTLDLPGTYYLEVVERLFRRNEFARGEFSALGRTVGVSDVKCPLFLLAGRDDDVTPPPQVLSARSLAGTPPRRIEAAVADCGHLSLFMGRRTLRTEWPRVADWIRQAA
jgi:poly(3-hydroxyalkanoate) synthetase